MSRTPAAKPRARKRASSAPEQRLSANMEDYLEVIFRLSQQRDNDDPAQTGSRKTGALVSSIAEAIGVKRPSVSKALKRLQREGLVRHTPYNGATVTQRGRQVAEAQVRSHRALTRFLQEVLALDGHLAEHDACLMEHAISPETVERLVRFIDHLDKHGRSITEQFRAGVFSRAERDRTNAQPGAGRAWRSRV